MTNYIERIRETIKCLNNRYDAENDIIPGAPVVTYTDRMLLDAIGDLVHIVEGLLSEINNFKRTLNQDALPQQVICDSIDEEIGIMGGRDLDEILRGWAGESPSDNSEDEQ